MTTGGHAARRANGNTAGERPRLRLALFAAATVAMVLAAWAFAYSLQQSRQARQALAAEVRHHCLRDTRTSNRQRALDLALLAADRQVIARLTVFQAAGDTEDKPEADAALDYYRAAARARAADLPAYESLASCLTSRGYPPPGGRM